MPAPILFLPHGGGPLPLMDDPAHAGLIGFLRSVPQRFAKPRAVVVISGHWEAAVPGISASSAPPLLFDYTGFPPETYRIGYPAPGHPQLASRIGKLLRQQGLASQLVTDRGFDHGVFVPLKLMYPAADVPCVQVSLVQGLDPATHIKLGRALASLPADNIAIIGSGMSFHNLRALFAGDEPRFRQASDSFDTWLVAALTGAGPSDQERADKLQNWQSAPYARFCHPREEHLLPLHVCFGAAVETGKSAQLLFNEALMGHKVSGFGWS